jgi:hypothetical protein
VVLYGCETRSLTLRKEHRLKIFENWVPRRIFGQRRDEVTGGLRRLHDEELHNTSTYSSSSTIRMTKSRRMRWTQKVTRRGEKRNPYSQRKETTRKTKT